MSPKQTLKQLFYIYTGIFSTSSNIADVFIVDENIGLLQDDDLYIEDENDKNEVLLEEPQISSKSTSKPITNPIITQPIRKRQKPRDTVSEQILNYLDKKNKTCEEKSDEESFALSIILSLKRMTD